ncbi:hypothetical protein Poli38472_013853 [Pythium oligandrum]|uniref:Cyclic nucleotide-binding domain-containing protein n=1 Tax=Pythium oligandrum TaxID=41045 RepID=A0A8K1C274_PYTOL|nr:hypothetical protein Poli38472_013853 [Pythium oligandrum]|eukprot:TMW55091.1 hypothetical protein Poli38472_013853 [Pythium oligandrum]
MEVIGEETTETTALEDGVRASKAKARWKKLRAATCVFILFRRRTTHGVRQQKLSRKAVPVFLGERNGRGASVFASTLFSPRGTGSSPHVAKLYAMKLERFECLLQKPIQNRSDIDIKLLAEFIRNTRFFTDLSSASIDALARHIRFCEYHEGEVLYRQGDTIHEVCGRCMVIRGSVFVYKNSDYVQSAREGEDYTGWYLNAVPGSTREAIKYGDCIDTCNIGDIFGDDAVYANLFRERTVIAQENTVIACIIRTDYQQTVRFNIPNDNQLIDHSNRTSFSALSSSFAILDTMNLAHRLTTNQRVQAAMSLRYRCLTPGDIVFKEGHEGQAIYIILFGKIRLCTMRASEAKTSGGSNDLHGELVIELGEGDVFGEEAFWDMYGSTRSSTAIAGLDEVETEILYLTRADYDTILGCGLRSNQRTNNTVVPMKFFGLQQQHMTAADRWRMAIYQVIHCRTSRSQWLSVISMAHERRIDLLFDIVKPLFTDTPRHQIKQLCRSAVLRTFGADSIVYSRGDTMVDECFLVVSGSVALQQTFFGAGNNNAALANANNPPSTDTTSVKVTIHVVESGGIFGEFETLGNCSKRHISAVVLQPDTKLLLLPAEDFVSFWPEKSRLDAKLALLKSQIRSVCRLDLDQTCSLYYAAHHQSYRRNDVISGKQEQEGSQRYIDLEITQ